MSEPKSDEATFTGRGPDEVFRDGLQRGVFRIQHCRACTKHVFYPRVVCPHCGSPELRWVTPSGSGTVYSTTIIRRKQDKGGDYNVAIVEMAEGPRLMTRIEDVAPERIAIGMTVTARVKETEKGNLLVFIPDGRT